MKKATKTFLVLIMFALIGNNPVAAQINPPWIAIERVDLAPFDDFGAQLHATLKASATNLRRPGPTTVEDPKECPLTIDEQRVHCAKSVEATRPGAVATGNIELKSEGSLPLFGKTGTRAHPFHLVTQFSRIRATSHADVEDVPRLPNAVSNIDGKTGTKGTKTKMAYKPIKRPIIRGNVYTLQAFYTVTVQEDFQWEGVEEGLIMRASIDSPYFTTPPNNNPGSYIEVWHLGNGILEATLLMREDGETPGANTEEQTVPIFLGEPSPNVFFSEHSVHKDHDFTVQTRSTTLLHCERACAGVGTPGGNGQDCDTDPCDGKIDMKIDVEFEIFDFVPRDP